MEHDPLELWRTQRDTAAQALRQLAEQGHDLTQLRGAGITNQRETTVLWRRDTGQPVARAIVWQDRRTEPQCAQWREQGLADTIRQKTGPDHRPLFSGSKLQWLLDHVDGARAAAEKGELAFGTVDCWLLWNLTGGRVHATDVSNASRTMLFNIHTNDWDDDLLALMNTPRSVLPQVCPSSHVYGEVDARILQDLGVKPRPRCPWVAWLATSKPPCSGKRALRPAWPRTPMAPAASCCCTPARQLTPRPTVC